MTTLMETTTRQVVLPRVNLLPPEIGEQRRFRRTQLLLGAGLLGTVAVVAGVYVLAASEVGRASTELAGERAEGAQLQTEADTFAEVPRTYALVEAKESQVGLAMGEEIRWSYLLNDLSRTTPEQVWLAEMTVAQDVDGTAAAVVDPALGTVMEPGLGQITFTGKALAHNDVATWLESLATQRGYTQPYFSNSQLTEIGTKDAIDYSSQVTITAEALSGRYAKGAE